MKEKTWKKIILTIAIILGIILSCTPVFADVGGVQRYDGSTSRSRTSTSSRTSQIPIGGIIILVIGGGTILFFWGKKKGMVKDISDITKMGDVLNEFKKEANLDTILNPQATQQINVGEKVRQIDPMFSEEKFLNWTKDVFVKLQTAWTKREWSIIRPFESNELFETHSAQLQEFIKAGRINIVERINVQKASLRSFTQDGDKETIKVDLDAVMRDYIIEEKTKKVIEGNAREDQYMKYTLTFMRKAGVKTQEGKSNMSTTNCPNCGAPTQITSAGQCEYCGSVITTGEHDWVLSGLEGRR